MKIGTREISNFGTPYVIAEISANHNGDMSIARRLVEAAKNAGCDCVKFQSWTKESLFAKKVYRSGIGGPAGIDSQNFESLLDRYSLSEANLKELSDITRRCGMDFASSAFSRKEVDFLMDELKVKFMKVASMDLNNLSFLDYVARKGVPVMLSTGLGTLAEIDDAVRAIEHTENRELAILHCVSVYPLPDELANLNNLDMLRKSFPSYTVGFSDHSLGSPVALAAIAKGAAIIEKHFTLDRDMPGWDHKVSATPEEMTLIVQDGRRIVKALGSCRREVSDTEKKNIPAYRRSVVAARDIPTGKRFEESDLDVKRPGTGLDPWRLNWIIGKVAKRSIGKDELLALEDF